MFFCSYRRYTIQYFTQSFIIRRNPSISSVSRRASVYLTRLSTIQLNWLSKNPIVSVSDSESFLTSIFIPSNSYSPISTPFYFYSLYFLYTLYIISLSLHSIRSSYSFITLFSIIYQYIRSDTNFQILQSYICFVLSLSASLSLQTQSITTSLANSLCLSYLLFCIQSYSRYSNSVCITNCTSRISILSSSVFVAMIIYISYIYFIIRYVLSILLLILLQYMRYDKTYLSRSTYSTIPLYIMILSIS